MLSLNFQTQMGSLRLIGLHGVGADTEARRLASSLQLAFQMSVFLLNFSFTGLTFFESGVVTEDASLAIVSMFVALMGLKALVLHVYQTELREVYAGLNDEKDKETATSRRLNTLFIVVMTCAILAGVVYLLHPLVTKQYGKFPMSFRVPFDVSEPRVYAAAYALAAFSLYNNGVCHIVPDSAVVMLAGRFCNRFIALGESFRNLSAAGKYQEAVSLRACVVEHCELLRLLREFRKIASITYFVHVFASAALVCLAAYTTLRTESQKQRGVHITFLIAALMQLFVYCYVGQQITNVTEDLHLQCYSSAWYNYSVETKKSLAIVLSVTHRTVILKGCQVVDMSFRMFLKVITESYSYLMILLSVM